MLADVISIKAGRSHISKIFVSPFVGSGSRIDWNGSTSSLGSQIEKCFFSSLRISA